MFLQQCHIKILPRQSIGIRILIFQQHIHHNLSMFLLQHPVLFQRPISAKQYRSIGISLYSTTFIRNLVHRPLPSHSPPADVTDHSMSIWNTTSTKNFQWHSLVIFSRDTTSHRNNIRRFFLSMIHLKVVLD